MLPDHFKKTTFGQSNKFDGSVDQFLEYHVGKIKGNVAPFRTALEGYKMVSDFYTDKKKEKAMIFHKDPINRRISSKLG
jgi:hypothetical protein